jgi:uncharacterized membrane protein YvbJ
MVDTTTVERQPRRSRSRRAFSRRNPIAVKAAVAIGIAILTVLVVLLFLLILDAGFSSQR